MEKVRSFYRHQSPDCPLAISYYAPVAVAREPYYPQSNGGFSITLMQAGQVEIFTKGRSHILSAGDIFLLPPRQLHTFRTMTMDTRYIFLSVFPQLLALPEEHFFQRDFVKPLFSGQLLLPELIRPGDALYPALHSALQVPDINKEGTQGYTAQLFAAVVSLCAALLPYCTPVSPKEAADRQEDTALACLEYIRRHYAEKITLQQLADQVHLHPNYLCALFKEQTGKTVFEYLDRYRVRRAARLLSSTALSVAAIAERCGFGSVSFFSRKFRALMGMSPMQYRKHYASAAGREDPSDT